MTTRQGAMPTDRPERYAKQLAGHWAAKGTVTTEGETTIIAMDSGSVVRMTPRAGALDLEISVGPDGDADRFATVVAEHLQRFGQRDELQVTWQPA